MAVVPFIWEGMGRTVAVARSEFDAGGGVNGDLMLIEGFDHSQLDRPGETNVSYDLRVGAEYRDHREMGKRDLLPRDTIRLMPGGAVIIETEELICLPRSMFGHVVPKVSLLQEGLSNTSSKVDPGYHGKLLITVFNLGKKKVELERGKPFCSLYVLGVIDGARPYDKEAKRIMGVRSRHPWQALRDMLEANSAALSVVLILAYIVQVVVIIALRIF